MTTDTVHPIRARAHLLRLLGEELIGDDRLAIFELVKNGYDADANEVAITVNLSLPGTQSIVVQDSGTGMTLDDITGKWLELATDSRRKNRAIRTKRYHRLALGEKGVGRIASLKLGRYVILTTRSEGHPEYETAIDWDELLEQGPYLDGLNVRVRKNTTPRVFEGASTGTRIEISGLRREHWMRGDLRKLYRLVTSLASPFKTPDQFTVKFDAPGREGDLTDLVAPNDFLDLAVWKFDFSINGQSFDWIYTFNPPRWRSVKSRVETKKDDRLLLTPAGDPDNLRRRPTSADEMLLLGPKELEGIGPIEGRIYGYYRRSEVLNATGSSSQVKSWLDDQTGVRVYRDGVRVFTYGERNDDWLGLNVRRINTPAGKLGTGSVVAVIHLELDKSDGLREKTNREGFDQNIAFERLRRVVLSVFEHLERLHSQDRKALDDVIKGAGDEKPVRFTDAMEHLRSGLKSKKLDQSFAKDIDAIEQEFTQLRDVMTNAGVAGLNLAVIFHEVEREVDSLATALDRGVGQDHIRAQISHLHQLLQGFAPLLRKNATRLVFASAVVRAALATREPRYRHHKVAISAPVLHKEQPDFKVRGASNLISGALGNLLDNAQFWARYRKERDGRAEPAAVLVATDWDEQSNSGFIAVVDNGPGFSIPLDRAGDAFFTTRPGGMGLGLYFAKHVMDQCGGELTIHPADEFRDEMEIPKAFDGAAVVLRFREAK
ncbi:ATP-binding protein [Ralstonia pseudosolanacearum]|uniref:histidine kinase n=1 Tax=Ralstonia solanacearum TaxID=305 RepID=A0A0S4TVP4_RALSL|nr:Histidine kinase [Ralstonia solanacearum]